MPQSVEIQEQYRQYLMNEKEASENTLSSYMRDMRQVHDYLLQEQGKELEQATENDLKNYLSSLREAGKSNSTIARNIASWKNFYQ